MSVGEDAMASSLAYRIDSDDEVLIRPVGRGPSAVSEAQEPRIPAWLARTARAVLQLRFLEPNWNNRGASAPDANTLLRALDLLVRAASYDTPPPDVVPTAIGGVQLEWHRCRMDIELEVAPEGKASLYWHKRDTGREWEGELASWWPSELQEAIGELTARSLNAPPHGAR